MRAAAEVRLIVRCKACGHQVEPDPVEMAARYGAETSVLDWREKLVFFKCGSRGAPGRNTGGHAIRALTREAVASPADHIRRSTLRRAYRTSRNESAAQCGSSSDSPLEGDGFEPIWGFSCQVVFWVVVGDQRHSEPLRGHAARLPAPHRVAQ